MRSLPLALSLVVPFRVGLDWLWWVPGPAGLSLGQAASGALLIFVAASAASGWRRIAVHPHRWLWVALLAWIVIGAFRAPSTLGALTYGTHLALPVLWLAALAAHPLQTRVVASWVAIAGVPMVAGLGFAALGQPDAHVLHGWPRLVSGYGNVHTHAGVAVVVLISAGGLRLAGRRWAAAVMLAAVVCLALTFVRTAWLWAVLSAVGLALARRRWRWVAVAVFVGALLLLASGRFTDVVAVLLGTAPPGGWHAVGSFRGHIWSDSLASFWRGGAGDRWLGRGLGGHLGLHRHLEPHSGVLSLLFQLGPIGVVLWAAWGAVTLRALWGRAAEDTEHGWVAAVAFGLLLGALATAPLSNDWLARVTVQAWVWGAVGVAMAREPAGTGATARPAPA